MISANNRQVILNLLTSLLRFSASIAIFVWVTPYVREILGNDGMGFWWFALSIAGYFSLLFSLSTVGITKYVAEYRARADRESLISVVSTGLILHIVLMVILLFLGAGGYYIASLSEVISSSRDMYTAKLVLAIVIIDVVLKTPFAAIQAVIQGAQRYDFLNILAIVIPLVRACATVLLLREGYGLVAVAISVLTVDLVSNLIMTCFAKSIRGFGFSWNGVRWKTARLILSFGVPSFVATLSEFLDKRSDAMIIGIMISTPSVTVYGLGQRIFAHILQLVCVTDVLMPVASELSTLPDGQRQHKIEELFIRGSRLGGILSLPIVLFLLFLGNDFIQVWQGPAYQYASQSYYILVILLIPGALAFLQRVSGPILLGLRAYRFQSSVAIVAAIVNVALSFALARPYGIVGVALGTAIPELIKRVILQFYYKKALQISMCRYYWGVLSRLVPLCFIYIFGLWCQHGIFGSVGKALFLMMAAANIIIFYIFSYFALDSYERKVVRQIVAKVFLLGKNRKQKNKSEAEE